MQIVQSYTVRDYRWNKYASFCQFVVSIVLFYVAYFLFSLALRSRHTDAREPVEFLIAVMFGLVAFFLLVKLDLFKQDEENSLYGLLEDWEKHSGLPVSDFPTSSFQVKCYAKWARQKVFFLAQSATEAFEEQEELQRVADAWLADPPGSTSPSIKRVASIMEKDLDQAGAKARAAGIAFLGFWDLVTEKGVGILEGPQWQDPEVFRKRIRDRDPEVVV